MHSETDPPIRQGHCPPISLAIEAHRIAYGQSIAVYAPWPDVICGDFGPEIGGTKGDTSLCFMGFRLVTIGKLCHIGSFRQRDIEGPSRLAYTALALALTMILKRCRLVEVEEPERNSAMQTADRLGSRRGKQLGEGSGPGKSTQHPF
jgi:hypothetical protein